MTLPPIDKQAHFYAGLAMYLALTLFVNPTYAAIIVVAAAWGKEAFDSRTHAPDTWDAYATMLGGILGSLILLVKIYV